MIPALVFAAATTAACTLPDRPPRVVHNRQPIAPDSPTLEKGTPLNVLLAVRIGADGRLESVRVAKSSGDADVDNAAIAAARGSTYAAARVDCRAIPQEVAMRYLFSGPVLQLNDATPVPDAASVAPPHLDVPAGWRFRGTSSDDVASWTRGSGTLAAFGLAERDSLTEIENERMLAVGALYARILEQRTVTVCGGSQWAFEIVYVDADRNLTAELYDVTPAAGYETLYTAKGVDSLDPAVERIMRSTCAPRSGPGASGSAP